MPTVRPCEDRDIAAVTALYAHHVLHGTGTFETVPPTEADMRARRAEVLSRTLPYLVLADDDDSLAGFAYCNWFKPRPAYRYSAEDSIYLAPGRHGRGDGRLLLQALVDEAGRAGVRKLIAVIGDSGNAGSIGVHRALGFTRAGVLRDCGWKFGRWLDVVLMEKSLGAGSATSPEIEESLPGPQSRP
jgi:L-amino acid N-acyltransferase YncA